MFHTCIRRRFHSGSSPVTFAIRIMTKEGTPSYDFFWNGRLFRVIAWCRTFRVFHYSFCSVGSRMIPVAAPFPYIPCHVQQSKPVGSIGTSRCQAFKLIPTYIAVGKVPLPG